tara:strand:- start:298 stop:933 length:636 start_codon:yes stop_codon:yes gene_type:complete
MKNIFWLDDPLILFQSNQIMQLWPFSNLSMEEKLNALTRLVILLTILGYIITRRLSIFVIGILTIIGIVFLYNKRQIKSKREGFGGNTTKIDSNFFNLEKNRFTQPTKKNPLMNVLLPEIIDNPQRPPAAPAYEEPVEKVINNSIMDPRLFLDLGDNLAFDRSMRNFYAMPNTTVPNDQKGFGEFCYGDMPSCKEQNEFQCAKNNSAMRPF